MRKCGVAVQQKQIRTGNGRAEYPPFFLFCIAFLKIQPGSASLAIGFGFCVVLELMSHL